MGKTNWKRVFLGGLLAMAVIRILGYLASVFYLEKVWHPAMEALGLSTQFSVELIVFMFARSLGVGILAVWLYSAILPRYGAGPKTAVIAGLAVWILNDVLPAITLGEAGLYPANVLVINSLTSLVRYTIATLAGAWIYKEEQ